MNAYTVSHVHVVHDAGVEYVGGARLPAAWIVAAGGFQDLDAAGTALIKMTIESGVLQWIDLSPGTRSFLLPLDPVT
ncbi:MULTISPECIES: hypothetical protein [Variovorax]|jgi:hypothetical protein|uniref:hypothetical protein n=1 Tax=Variovorax sp. 3P27G3 TaxID=2502214 RepID=UPI0010F57C59|nr:hypothetical protein [Variovorax sp. 3P27G3]